VNADDARARPHSCPVCRGTILYLDGQPTPDLVRAPSGALMGCDRCVGRRRHAPPADPAHAVRSAESRTRSIAQEIREDGPKVLDFIAEGASLIERAARLFKLYKPTPKP
jgi:hypothetical protein